MPTKKLAIIVPYRNREEHLVVFSAYMNNYMKSNFKDIDFDIFIIEQFGDKPFNRGKLINIGAIMAKDYDYFILHDVDMLPITSDYSYNDRVTHLARHVYEQSNDGQLVNNYVTNTGNYAGGVIKLSKDKFYEVNGFDNDYWGWGGEDDELKLRLISKGYKIFINEKLHYFITLKHKMNVKSPDTDELFKLNLDKSILTLKQVKDKTLDCNKNGLNNIAYGLLKTEYINGYIKYTVTI